MKLRYVIIFILALAAITLNACTLASDVTPPPDYVAPTPMPTLGPLFPASAPSIENGAQIYAAKCAACHGDTGLGDGPDGKQLPVRVPALGLAESAQSASPAQWFKVVSQGNIERAMPPFISLTDQQRWDVVSYAMSLHITPGQIARGKSLFEANCRDCQNKFTDQEKMASLSEADLFRIIKNGNADVAAFGTNFTDEETWAVAAYLRTLTFAPPAAAGSE
ncbi:MAG: c-type cytochrome, partial [Chloroflexi bacterium]|nr:c-type cytochrome [Chloroflexota bacterium]